MRTLLFFVPTGKGFSPNPHIATYPRRRIDFLACGYARTFIIYILLSGENQEHLYLYAFLSASMAISSQRKITLKSRRDERTQTGAQAPGNGAMVKKVLKGRQR